MAATYSITLDSDKDWVRFLSGDRDTTNARLQDEEINALLVEEKNKYLAAARACDLIMSRANGLVMKQVGDLKLQFGGSAQDAYSRHAKLLRERGATLLLPANTRAFRVI